MFELKTLVITKKYKFALHENLNYNIILCITFVLVFKPNLTYTTFYFICLFFYKFNYSIVVCVIKTTTIVHIKYHSGHFTD